MRRSFACRFWPTIKNRRTRKNKIRQTRRRFVPRLNDMMVATQLRHFKLWYAGVVQNWPLANYEFETNPRPVTETQRRLYPNNGRIKHVQ